MVFTAFSGNALANMGINALTQGLDVSNDIKYLFIDIAQTIPTVVAVSWLNWILMRLLIILPLNHLLQITSFIYDFLGLPCLSRAMRGGGPGGPVPYRIYIDSGMVFLCLHALAPVAPIIAPACLCYFLFSQPLLRRNLIFVYRPHFDGGGHRWPFIFTVCISSLIVGEVLLAVQMALKQATGPTILCVLSILPTLMFSSEMHRRYYKSFEDAALCQTSMLDGWYNDNRYTFAQREQFRQFLVDAHKASYVSFVNSIKAAVSLRTDSNIFFCVMNA
jgi:Calcium-dependent channel, 7TM region, putative phosphate